MSRTLQVSAVIAALAVIILVYRFWPAAPVSVPAAPAATMERATEGAAPTIRPTEASIATAAPTPTILTLAGVAPVSGTDCPDGAPVKGNVRDRNPGKGDKIYHLPGDNGYELTKPERCFVSAAEAEAAGFRPVK